jgi:dihydropteroate synthase
MHRCVVGGITIGQGFPVRLMGVINCSPESFFHGSYVRPGTVRIHAEEMVSEGADIIDIGARSTAPLSPPVSEETETERILAALSELDGSGIPVSVDTMRRGVLEPCLDHDIRAVNDISGFADPAYARRVGDAGLPAILMASRDLPGDAAGWDDTLANLSLVVSRCEAAGVSGYVLDPGIGLWTPGRTTTLDWEICRNFDTCARFGRPILAAVSRKTFLGEPGGRPPEDRLPASLGLTALLIGKGADLVRTHDVSETAAVIRMAARVVERT